MTLPLSFVFFVLLGLSVYFYYHAKSGIVRKAALLSDRTKALPSHYGQQSFLWAFIPSFLILLVLTIGGPNYIDQIFYNKIQELNPTFNESFVSLILAKVINVSNGKISTGEENIIMLAKDYKIAFEQLHFYRGLVVILCAALLGMIISYRQKPGSNAREQVEKFIVNIFFASAVIAIFTTVAIILSLFFEALRFFNLYNFFDFIFGLHWAPNVAIRTDQVAAEGSFGMIPVLLGTLLISFIAMCVAIPIGLFSAIYLAEFATPKIRDFVKPTLEILAGIPTVVYGYFAALTAAPFFRDIGFSLGLDVSSESAIAAGAVMGIMIIPFISSLSDDVIRAVPQSLRDGSMGLGATKAETIYIVILPAAIPGLVGAVLLAVSRAIGETMIVVMAAGLSANLTVNPLESVTTVTVQIVSLLTGDTEFDDIKTLSAFGLGLALFFFTLLLNIFALSISRRLAERYD